MRLSTLSNTFLALGICGLTACGGGGSSTPTPAPTPTPTPAPTTGWVAGTFAPATDFEHRCATPRSGNDPFNNNQPYPDQQGTAMDEKMWLRSWSHETYLWYDEINDQDPAGFDVPGYFAVLKTNALTDSGIAKDNFHFSENTAEYKERTEGGVTSGYGISWEFVRSAPPRELLVRYTEPNSPAAIAGIMRGASLLKVNDVDFINGNDVDTLNAGLFPNGDGQNYRFTFRLPDGSEQEYSLTSAQVNITPVQGVKIKNTAAGKVGYMRFNSHVQVAQPSLISAFQQFADNNINQLVIDLRYNGGGLLAMASQVAYMVAGNQSNGRVFEQMQYNNKVTNPSPTPFYNKRIDYDAGVLTSENLPALNLKRVYVLSTGNTCSASEAFINGLRGIDVEVHLIGSKTCGKPYGFLPTDNCGTTYFTIQFQGVNSKGFGEYADGFIPTLSPQFAADVKGCVVADDLNTALAGDDDPMLNAAIRNMQDGSCPVAPQPAPLRLARPQAENSELAIKSPHPVWQQNSIRLPIQTQ